MNNITNFFNEIEEQIALFNKGEINAAQLKDYFFNKMQAYSQKNLAGQRDKLLQLINNVNEKYNENILVDDNRRFHNAGIRHACALILEDMGKL